MNQLVRTYNKTLNRRKLAFRIGIEAGSEDRRGGMPGQQNKQFLIEFEKTVIGLEQFIDGDHSDDMIPDFQRNPNHWTIVFNGTGRDGIDKKNFSRAANGSDHSVIEFHGGKTRRVDAFKSGQLKLADLFIQKKHRKFLGAGQIDNYFFYDFNDFGKIKS